MRTFATPSEMREYALSVRQDLLPLLGWSILPLFIILPIRVFWFPDSDRSSWVLLMVLAPATEEAVKLSLVLILSFFVNFATLSRPRHIPKTEAPNSPKSELVLLLLPVSIGVFYGAWEHVSTYPTEPALAFVIRIAAHTGYTSLAFATCLFIWRKGYAPAMGLWVGTVTGMVPHAIFNVGPVAPLDWPVHGLTYTFSVGFASFVLALMLLGRDLQHEPGSRPARVLVASMRQA